jgi:F-type H+-transporting ATPase subunit b
VSINATLFGQAITFALFVWFTMKYVWPFIISAMQEREQKIADGIAAGERGRFELEKAHDNARNIIQEAMTKAAGIIEKANQRGNTLVENAEQLAKEKANHIIEAAKQEVEQQKIRLKSELKNEVAEIAMLGAERIIKKKMDNSAQKELLTDLIANF